MMRGLDGGTARVEKRLSAALDGREDQESLQGKCLGHTDGSSEVEAMQETTISGASHARAAAGTVNEKMHADIEGTRFARKVTSVHTEIHSPQSAYLAHRPWRGSHRSCTLLTILGLHRFPIPPQTY